MSDTLAPHRETYVIDAAHSHVRFWVRHLMISKVHGEFGSPSGTVVAVPGDPTTAELTVTIPTSGITTGNEGRDAHLKNADFFDVEQYPALEYRSTKITALGGDEYEIEGDLTMHGVTAPVTLRAEISEEVPSPFGGTKVGVSAKGKLDRETFGLTYNAALEAGGVAISKDVHLEIDVELDRAAQS